MADHLDQIADGVHADSRLIGVAYDVGALEAEALGEWPRIVWVSEEGAIGPPDDIGPQLTAAATWQRAVRTDNMAVTCQIWAEDREAARELMHNLIASAYDAAVGSVEFGRYRWITQQEARAEYASDGQAIALDMTWQLPIFDQTSTVTTIATQRQTATFVDDRDGDRTEGVCAT